MCFFIYRVGITLIIQLHTQQWVSRSQIRTAVEPLSKALNPTLLRGGLSLG